MKAEAGWQDAAGRRWVENQERTDAQLDPLGRAALACLAPARGERVLDIGCGAGQSTLQLSELVGATGSVVGIDISEPLLGRARERVNAAGCRNVELVLGNAATEHWEAPFDLMFSRFGVMFFEDPIAAFTHLRGQLKPSGRIGFVCWQALEVNPWAHAPLQAVRDLRPEHPMSEMLLPGQPGPFAFASPAVVTDVLSKAGFESIQVEPSELTVLFGGSRTLAEAVDYALSIGPAARFIADAGLDSHPDLQTALAGALGPYTTEQGVLVPARVLLVTARSAGMK